MAKAVATVLLAHCMAYVLVGALPKAGVAILGIGAADSDALKRFQMEVDAPRTYIEAFYRLVSFDFGRSMDGTSVTTVVATALKGSMPLLVVSGTIIALTMAVTLMRPRHLMHSVVQQTSEFLAFIPAYLFGFVALAVSVAGGSVVLFVDSLWRDLVLGIAIGLGPACLALSTVCRIYSIEADKQYVTFMRACGFDDDRIYRNLRKAGLGYAIPSWEKLFSLQLSVLIFTEAVFSYPGFGSMLLRAIQRSDLNMILASVTLISALVVAVRTCGAVVRLSVWPFDLDVSSK
jgi:ABC-type dipeptide/oligopeptide/nickel transport system permease component